MILSAVTSTRRSCDIYLNYLDYLMKLFIIILFQDVHFIDVTFYKLYFRLYIFLYFIRYHLMQYIWHILFFIALYSMYCIVCRSFYELNCIICTHINYIMNSLSYIPVFLFFLVYFEIWIHSILCIKSLLCIKSVSCLKLHSA